jgi:hypothetical protein
MLRSTLALALVLAVGCDGEVIPRGGDAATDAGAGADGSVRDGGTDAGADADAGVDAGAPSGPVLYPADRRHSPITVEMAGDLSEVAARDDALADDVFMKVGDSITVSSFFLHCFAGSGVDLDGRDLAATVERFGGGDAAGSSPWTRESESAVVGWSANAALSGDPSPLVREHDALSPRFAVVMFGTNDVGYRSTQAFARDLWTITDTLLARGTVPLMSTIPPRDDSAAADALVPLYNLAVRAIAQGRGVPLVDFHRELRPLTDHGLSGDGVHPQVYAGGGCVLTAEALSRGYNVRNLITLEQLDRASRALAGEGLDADAPRLAGAGTVEDPHVVETFPFAAMTDTSTSTERGVDVYACSDADESGPARVYRLELDAPATVTAAVISAVDVDADVHLLRGEVSPEACVARDDRVLTEAVEAGTWYVVADTYVNGAGEERPGEALVLISVE